MNVLVGFYHIPSFGPDSVETELTGNGKADHESLHKLITAKHPKVEARSIVRTGSAIETRSDVPPVIEYPIGSILKNLFDGGTSDEDCSIRIGSVDFNKEPCTVVLCYNRAKNALRINLTERATKSTIRFTDSIAAMRLTRELPDIIKGILGPGARNLVLNLKETAPKA